MANEQNIEQTPKKKNGCLIGCGCFLAAIILGIIFISLIALFTVSSIKSAVKPDLDNFFEKYNNRDMNYICKNIIPQEVIGSECVDIMNKIYSDLGKEIDYNLSLLKGTYIKISSQNGKTKKIIKTTGDFEKVEDVNLEFEMFVDKSGKTKINYFHYQKD